MRRRRELVSMTILTAMAALATAAEGSVVIDMPPPPAASATAGVLQADADQPAADLGMP